jgi:hypothetical protein
MLLAQPVAQEKAIWRLGGPVSGYDSVMVRRGHHHLQSTLRHLQIYHAGLMAVLVRALELSFEGCCVSTL